MSPPPEYRPRVVELERADAELGAQIAEIDRRLRATYVEPRIHAAFKKPFSTG